MTTTWQFGITTRPQGHLLLLALAFKNRESPQALTALEALRGVVHRELKSDLDDLSPASPKDQPSAETGELGVHDGYDRNFLTITLGISASGFDALEVTADQRPQDLIPIPWGSLGDSPDNPESGDLILQVCSDSTFINEHVARRIDEELGEQLSVVWSMPGTQRFSSRHHTSKAEGRALIGFLDGTSNLDPRDTDDDRRLVFVDPVNVASYPQVPQPGVGGYGPVPPVFPEDLRPPPAREPDWTKDGTYMVVRASEIAMNQWDDITLGEQEKDIGRFKFSGSSLDLADDPADLTSEPAFVQNQSDERVAVDSHVRKTNPRRPEDADRRIFRRGYPLIQPSLEGVGLGLVFIAFARTISTQFEFIMRAWMKNQNFPRPDAGVDRLLQFEHVIAGGYYFGPPLEFKTEGWTWFIPPIT